MSASRSCRTTCARSLSLYADLLCKISLSGCLHQDPVGPLGQGLCMRISCAKCLGSPQQNPLEALVQDRCMRISCARCLCQDLLSRTTCARSLYAHWGASRATCRDHCMYESFLRKILQDVRFRISSAESCRSTCARSVWGSLVQDVYVKISSVRLVQDLCVRISCAYLCVRTTLPAFRVMDTHDLPRRLHFENIAHLAAVWARLARVCTSWIEREKQKGRLALCRWKVGVSSWSIVKQTKHATSRNKKAPNHNTQPTTKKAQEATNYHERQ